MAVTSTYGRQIAEECNCGHPSGTVSPQASSGWEAPGGHLVHLLLKVQGLTSWVFKTSKDAGSPALLGNLSHCLTMTSVLKIAAMSGIYLQDKESAETRRTFNSAYDAEALVAWDEVLS